MPPQQKFTREQILEKAMNIVREKGIKGCTARELAKALHSSSRPIFTAFNNMEEVHEGVLAKANALYNEYIQEGLQRVPAFQGVGQQYICFAIEEPKLFQLLFMNERRKTFSISDTLQTVDDNFMKIEKTIEEQYHLNKEQALRLYEHLWIYTHGIATLCITSVYTFSKQQINDLMSELCKSLLPKMKERKV